MYNLQCCHPQDFELQIFMEKQPVTEKLLKKVTEKIVLEVKPRKVVLFSAYVRGTACPDSDLDFLVRMVP